MPAAYILDVTRLMPEVAVVVVVVCHGLCVRLWLRRGRGLTLANDQGLWGVQRISWDANP